MIVDHAQIEHLIELRGVYDGWSIARLKDGRLINRWADDNGQPLPGYERRHAATEDAIRELQTAEETTTA